MLSHVDEKNQPTMVDISDKNKTQREASAESLVLLNDEVMSYFKDGDIYLKKGPVIQTAIISGTMAAKETARLIPFCHQINLSSVKIDINIEKKNYLKIRCRVKCLERTGVEMEALTGATLAALTIYDMCKAVSKNISIEKTYLVEKKGGKSDEAIK